MTQELSPKEDVFEAGLAARRSLDAVLAFAVLIDDKALFEAAQDLRHAIDETLDAPARVAPDEDHDER